MHKIIEQRNTERLWWETRKRGGIPPLRVKELSVNPQALVHPFQGHRPHCGLGSDPGHVSHMPGISWEHHFSWHFSVPLTVLVGRPVLLFFDDDLFLIYLFLAVLGLCCYAGFSLVVPSGGCSRVVLPGFSPWWLLSLQSTGSRVHRLQ